MRRKPYDYFLLGVILLIVGWMLVGCVPKAADNLAVPDNAEQGLVKRVVDGDTFVLEDNRKVRLIGINTPESVDPRRPVEYYGKQASKYTQKLLEGKKVWLQWGRTPKDKYDRWLAWVWLADGTFVNGHLVAEGYAQVYTFKDNPDHAEYLLELQKKAREEGRGLWEEVHEETLEPTEERKQQSAAETSANEGFIASRNSQVYHEFGCPGAASILESNKVYFQSEEEAQASGRRMCQVSGCTMAH
ncbi:thermonuclease family protein [Ammoniphilus sp. 3BR4]|uniref:thermonuclease family protein n=1 Tax=Ammoniphilus sp. 3BR4 TaxID=3158265 RepID=UPI003465612F